MVWRTVHVNHAKPAKAPTGGFPVPSPPPAPPSPPPMYLSRNYTWGKPDKPPQSDMESQGIIKELLSPYNSPLLLVPKKDGTWRIVIDYRRLNKDTIPDRMPMPNFDEVLSQLNGAKLFSALDLLSGITKSLYQKTPNNVLPLVFIINTGNLRSCLLGYLMPP